MKRFFITLASVLLLASPCFAMQGDIDNSGKVELQDAVLGLQVTAGLRNAADIGYTGSIGLPEVIYVLKVLTSVETPSGGDITNTLNMSFRLIPAGTFMMGSPETDSYANHWEKPQHQVTISRSFYMQTTEVTQGQWKAVMVGNPSYFSTCGDNCPVERVSWDDVQAFITKMNQRGEGTYRLPTEAEWEYAARAGSTTAFANGGITNAFCSSVDVNLDAMGWYCGNAGSKTHPVGQKQANAWGLFDMHGNVREWVEDEWHDNYTGAPSNGSAWIASPHNLSRVLRGGSWSIIAEDCRSADRRNTIQGGWNDNIGFRLVREQ